MCVWVFVAKCGWVVGRHSACRRWLLFRRVPGSSRRPAATAASAAAVTVLSTGSIGAVAGPPGRAADKTFMNGGWVLAPALVTHRRNSTHTLHLPSRCRQVRSYGQVVVAVVNGRWRDATTRSSATNA